jgi:hypothetical protein
LRQSSWFLLLLIATILPSGLVGQTKPSGIIVGKIFDRETGNPLDNAIIFLVNTPIGTSSEGDGTFRISFVPSGVYQMVASRVGYDREVMNLEMTKPESLYFEIKLQPKPFRTKEVEVVGKRPEGIEPRQYTFYPKESPNTYCIYSAGSSMPIGIFFSDSALYMYALDTAIVDSDKYIRLWMLYKNLSSLPYDFNPIRCTILHMHGKKDSFRDIYPEPPSVMLGKVNKESAVSKIAADVENILKRLAVVQTRSVFDEVIFDRWGHQSMRIPHMHGRFRPSTEGSLSADLYSIFTLSVNDGILKRYTVYPENSVSGYIFFPFPGLQWKITASGFPEATEYVYTIEIITQSGSKSIEFEPH